MFIKAETWISSREILRLHLHSGQDGKNEKGNPERIILFQIEDVNKNIAIRGTLTKFMTFGKGIALRLTYIGNTGNVNEIFFAGLLGNRKLRWKELLL